MTIELSKETKSLIEKALASGQFDSAEHVVQYALHATLSEQNLQHDEAYNEYLRGLLAEAQTDKEAGHVYTVAHGELQAEIKRRRKTRQNSSEPSNG